MKKWEHTTAYLRFNENQSNFETYQDQLFESMQRDGWELVSVLKTQFRPDLSNENRELEDWMVYYFKIPRGKDFLSNKGKIELDRMEI